MIKSAFVILEKQKLQNWYKYKDVCGTINIESLSKERCGTLGWWFTDAAVSLADRRAARKASQGAEAEEESMDTEEAPTQKKAAPAPSSDISAKR